MKTAPQTHPVRKASLPGTIAWAADGRAMKGVAARTTEAGATQSGGVTQVETSRAAPVRAGDDLESDFVSHMLGHRPAQKFKVFQCGQKWTVPEE